MKKVSNIIGSAVLRKHHKQVVAYLPLFMVVQCSKKAMVLKRRYLAII